MCPYANYQIVGFSPMPGKDTIYPLREYLRRNVKVSVNTDNIGISEASISDNFMLLIKLCPGITRMEILQLIKNSIEMSFAGKTMQNWFLKKFNHVVLNSIQNNMS